MPLDAAILLLGLPLTVLAALWLGAAIEGRIITQRNRSHNRGNES